MLDVLLVPGPDGPEVHFHVPGTQWLLVAYSL